VILAVSAILNTSCSMVASLRGYRAMAELPPTAAWRLVDAHDGFEVVFLRQAADGIWIAGHSTGVEAGEAWSIGYELALTPSWTTRTAQVRGRSAAGTHEVRLEADGTGGWRVDGFLAPHLAGCLDVDLEGSALTNALPVQRLGLEVGARAEAPAAYVRAAGLGVERLEQTYARLEDRDGHPRYDYASPRFEYEGVLTYDQHGLVLEYPGIAVRFV
jgi:uncharacterized protein